ncbi:MAG: 50S ribosomal protein L7Ae-like protein [Clostridiales bacterium]|nr:50S ribosomal protein L7Ae-like protein [Clostridiales bacterium]
MLEDLKYASNKAVGMKQTLKAIQQGSVEQVFLARDIDDYISNKIKDQCQNHGVSIIMVDSMKELGEACSITVGAATAAILKDI